MGRDDVADEALVAGAVLAGEDGGVGDARQGGERGLHLPGSIRKPRIFTWWSARPANSSSPSARHRPRSPVRYIRDPGGP